MAYNAISRKVPKDVTKLITKYSKFHQSILTIDQFTRYGRPVKESHDQAKLVMLKSMNFLRHEIPIRLAHIMSEINYLPEDLRNTSSVALVNSWYVASFMDILEYKNLKNELTETETEAFTKTLYDIKKRHDDTVEQMAQGIMELKEASDELDIPSSVQYFLDRFYMNRIGIRMLITQHLALHEESLAKSAKSRYIGLFDPTLNVKDVVSDAAGNASLLCHHYYFNAPDVTIREHNTLNPGSPVVFSYVPSHLYHIVFELLKNSMRATVEKHEEDNCDMSNVEIDIVKGDEDLSIRIADKGGGIPRTRMEKLFSYHYTTAPQLDNRGDGMAPLAGHGYGLPLSRIYAKYFGGDIQMNSMEGYGTQAFIFLKLLSSEAHEVLPLYSKKVQMTYNAQSDESSQTLMRDWSSGSFYEGQTQSYLIPRTKDTSNGV